jgi:DNA-binding Lrp family transcriptional regulator
MKGQDIIVVLKLFTSGSAKSYVELGQSLGMSASEAHAAVRRLIEARLLDPDQKRVNRQSLLRFLIHGVPFVFPAAIKETTRGMPTAWAAPVMQNRVLSNELPPVWPDPEGVVRGQSVKPLYPSVVFAASQDGKLYDVLALVDVLRLGRARERKIAEDALEIMLKEPVA